MVKAFASREKDSINYENRYMKEKENLMQRVDNPISLFFWDPHRGPQNRSPHTETLGAPPTLDYKL